MRIDLLGPVLVDGHAKGLAPRDRVLLSLLAVRPGDAISADTLADAMWPEGPPPSWRKVLQGTVVRLRKHLGADAIETVGHGYRLTVPREDIDAWRFESEVDRARDLLAVGENALAAHVLQGGLAMWRGRALAEISDQSTGWIEGQRLEELRRDAEELAVEAALRSGNHHDVLAPARALVREAPLRERRWALLARAQYQAGRQGEALATLREVRAVLQSELALDPGPELVDLERAILNQDPTLAAHAMPEASQFCPYLGLVPFDVDDADAFFGRERDIDAGIARLAASGVLAVVGPSGSGKSSLVRAGIAARIRRTGRTVYVVAPGRHPLETLPESRRRRGSVIVVDQFEEAITSCESAAEREAFFDALVSHAEHDPLVLALRADRLGDLAAHTEMARMVEQGLYLLTAMGPADLRAAVEGPARQAGLVLESGLIDLVVTEVEGEPGALPLLSHTLRQTWLNREGRTLTVQGYRATGGVRGAVAQSAEDLYEQVAVAQRPMLRNLLLRLVTPTPEGEPVRSRVPRRQVAPDADHERLIEMLVHARLVTSDDGVVEIAHEALARVWPRLRGWLDDDTDGQRILRHLSVAADTWDSMERTESELYRGARLAQALEWLDRDHPDLTPTERGFLDASRDHAIREEESAAAQARAQRRVNRRLRALLAGTVALLLLAAAAGAYALRQADRAELAARDADARRISEQALTTDRADHALLLAVEGYRRNPSAEGQARLAQVLARFPNLVRMRSLGIEVSSLAIHPDGTQIAVASTDTNLVLAAATLEAIESYAALPGMTATYSPDGSLLVLTRNIYSASGHREIAEPIHVLDATTLRRSSLLLGSLPAGFAGRVAFSRDGRFLAAPLARVVSDGHYRPLSSVQVWDLAKPQRPVMTLHAGEFADFVALTANGRAVWTVADGELRLTAVPSGRVLGRRELSVPSSQISSATISSRGLLALSAGDRTLLFDARSLRPQGVIPRELGQVDLTFSPDGRLLAGAAGKQVLVWDTDALVAIHRFDAPDARAVAFSADGRSVYVGSPDGEVTEWDVSRTRSGLTWHPGFRWPPERLSIDQAPHQAVIAGLEVDTRSRRLTFATFDGSASDLPPIDLGPGARAWFAVHSDTDRLEVVTADKDGRLRTWDGRTGSALAEQAASAATLGTFLYSPDGSIIVVTDRHGLVRTLDAATLAPRGRPIRLAGSGETAVPVSSTRAVVDTGNRSIAVLDLVAGSVERNIPLSVDTSWSVATPDGRLVIVGKSGELGLLDPAGGVWVHPPLDRHGIGSFFAAVASDGATVLTTDRAGGIALWDTRTFALLGTAKVDFAGEIYGQFEPGSTLIHAFGAHGDGRAWTWDTNPSTWVDRACGIAGRNFSQEEWEYYFPGEPWRETCRAT